MIGISRGVLLATLLVAGTATAQKVESVKLVEPGDSASYKWSMGGKSVDMDEQYTEVADGQVKGVLRAADRNYDLRFGLPEINAQAGACLANGQTCTFSPGVQLFTLPLEKGRKWTSSFTVTGETFTSDVVQERSIDKLEKVKTPAGEFEAWKVSFSGKFKGKDAKGNAFSGKEDGTEWYSIRNGKAALVKSVYRNSFGEKASRDITKLDYK